MRMRVNLIYMVALPPYAPGMLTDRHSMAGRSPTWWPFALVLLAIPAIAHASPRHAYVADGGAPRYGPDAGHYEFANLSAPRNCTLRRSMSRGFDSLNPWIVKGRSPLSVYNWLYDSLLAESPSERMTGYALVAESIDAAPDRQSATFRMRPEARFHDGRPITSADVVFTAGVFRKHAQPFWRTLLRHAEVGAPDARTVRIAFGRPVDGMSLLAFGTMPILPAHYWRGRDFSATTLEPPLGSGPYRIAKIEPQRRLVWRRVDDYWAGHLPVRRGAHNFARVAYDVYLDATTELVAFLKGDTDIYEIRDPRRWATAADRVSASGGRIATVSYDAWWPMGMNGFFFNLRDDRFADIRVRQALAMLMPFEWVNRTMLMGGFRRTASYFENSVYAASRPPDARERSSMRRFPDAFPPRAYDTAFVPADAALPDGARRRLRAATALLSRAGWEPDPTTTRLRRLRDGRRMDFAALAFSNSQEALFGAWSAQLRRIGIDARLRVTDPASYQAKLAKGDFELIYRFYIPSGIPGRDQVRLWGGAAIHPDGGNGLGIDNPAVDHFLGKLVAAPDRAARVRAARLLDRALQWGHYAVPGFQSRHRRYAYHADRVVPLPPRPGRGAALNFWWCPTPDINPADGDQE